MKFGSKLTFFFRSVGQTVHSLAHSHCLAKIIPENFFIFTMDGEINLSIHSCCCAIFRVLDFLSLLR